MDENQTVSVSKGVFVFKNNFKKPSANTSRKRRGSKSRNECITNMFSENLWYQSYINLWSVIEENIEMLNAEMFSFVLSDLITFIKHSYDSENIEEIPTAALLTGINMPDHAAQFLALSKEIKETVTPHVACLYSQDCQNVKYLIEHMISQFINEENLSSNEDEILDENKYQYKKSQMSFCFLRCWYENLYAEKIMKSPKKMRTKVKRKVLVVIIPDFESFNPQVLQKFILMCSCFIKVLPFVFVLGIATSLTTLHMSLPYQVSSKISVVVFNSQPSTVYLNEILEKIFFTIDCPFQLGGKVFNLFTDIFLFYDLSVNNFIQNIRYAMAEHFSYGDLMALCNCDKQEIIQIISNFKHEDCENARHLLSFRKLVENSSYEYRIKLLTDDAHFKTVLLQEIYKIKKYIRRLHIFLKCLTVLVKDLPGTPLGKQVRELYSVAVSTNITKTPEYRECFQLLSFQSKEELSLKLSKIVDYLSPLVQSNTHQNQIMDFINELNGYLNKMNNFNMNDIEEAVLEIEDEVNLLSGQMDRKELKEKLLHMSKNPNKRMNRYEKIRKDVIECIMKILEEHLVEPNSFYFHEIFFFDNISIRNYVIGTHRAAIHNALNDPHYYLQCTSCCEIPNSSAIKLTMPDICIAYKLHLECGKMINLYDWLQAFLSILDPTDCDEESKKIVNPELQARFTQAVAELEYLGFIKSSKRKADHVTRLTWGG